MTFERFYTSDFIGIEGLKRDAFYSVLKNEYGSKLKDYSTISIIDALCELLYKQIFNSYKKEINIYFKYELICKFLLGSGQIKNLHLKEIVYKLMPKDHDYSYEDLLKLKNIDYEKLDTEYKRYYSFCSNLPFMNNLYLKNEKNSACFKSC